MVYHMASLILEILKCSACVNPQTTNQLSV